jgi:hypothetical protein
LPLKVIPKSTPCLRFETPSGLISGGKSGCGANNLNEASHFDVEVSPKYVINTTAINNIVQSQSLADIIFSRYLLEKSLKLNLFLSSLKANKEAIKIIPTIVIHPIR